MPKTYRPELAPFSEKIGADKMGKVRHNGSMEMLQPLTLKETAAFLGISRDMLSTLLNKGLLRSFHIGRRHFVSAEAIREFIHNQEENE